MILSTLNSTRTIAARHRQTMRRYDVATRLVNASGDVRLPGKADLSVDHPDFSSQFDPVRTLQFEWQLLVFGLIPAILAATIGPYLGI